MCMQTRTSLLEHLLGVAIYAVILVLFYFCLPKLPATSNFPTSLACPPPEFRTGPLPRSCRQQEGKPQITGLPFFLSTP
jgi:hypothetical protein